MVTYIHTMIYIHRCSLTKFDCIFLILLLSVFMYCRVEEYNKKKHHLMTAKVNVLLSGAFSYCRNFSICSNFVIFNVLMVTTYHGYNTVVKFFMTNLITVNVSSCRCKMLHSQLRLIYVDINSN